MEDVSVGAGQFRSRKAELRQRFGLADPQAAHATEQRAERDAGFREALNQRLAIQLAS